MSLRLWKTETTVNTITAQNQIVPQAAALPDGGYVVVWQDNGTPSDGSQGSIKMQRFDAFGVKAGVETLVNTTTNLNQGSPDVTVLADGTMWVSWTDSSNAAGNGTDIRYRRFTAEGAAIDAADRIGAGAADNQGTSQLSTLSNGDVVLAFRTNDTSGNIFAQRFDDVTGNAIGGPITVAASANNERQPSVAGLTGNAMVVAWQDDTSDHIRMAMYSNTGTIIQAPVNVSNAAANTNSEVNVLALSGGGFVLAWRDQSNVAPDTDSSAIHGQVFSAAGAEVGGEFVMNTFTTSFQTSPQLAELPDGRFVAVYGSNQDIRAQLFSAAGVKDGAEILVNTQIASVQSNPSVAVLADGRIAVTWTDSLGGSDIKQQILDPRDGDVDGTLGDDLLIGHDIDADTITGLTGADTLVGLGGDDQLHGGNNDDILNGGEGGDILNGATGTDTATYANAAVRVKVALDFSFAGEGEALNDVYFLIERVTGSAFGDVIRGDGLSNRLLGGNGNDTLQGMDGNDSVLGGNGADAITGGFGNDTFDYTALAHGGDTIRDFHNTAGDNDTLRFLGSAFGGLPVGALAANRFAANASGAATTADHRFVYETDAGILRFDSNGAGAGGVTVIATFTGAPMLAINDFTIN